MNPVRPLVFPVANTRNPVNLGVRIYFGGDGIAEEW